MRWVLALLAVIALSVNGWGCSAPAPDADEPFPGWLCGDAGVCDCYGIVRPIPGQPTDKGLCLEDWTR